MAFLCYSRRQVKKGVSEMDEEELEQWYEDVKGSEDRWGRGHR
jgi:hypothetical protein